MVVLTDVLLHQNSIRGGYTVAQLKVLGIGWPPKKGWKQRLIGTTISNDTYQAFQNAAGTVTRATKHHRAMLARAEARREQKRAQRDLAAYAINDEANEHMRSILSES